MLGLIERLGLGETMSNDFWHPRSGVVSVLTTAALTFGCGGGHMPAYHNSARDAGAAVARPIFSITGPLLSVSVAWLIVDLAERRSVLDKRRTIG